MPLWNMPIPDSSRWTSLNFRWGVPSPGLLSRGDNIEGHIFDRPQIDAKSTCINTCCVDFHDTQAMLCNVFRSAGNRRNAELAIDELEGSTLLRRNFHLFPFSRQSRCEIKWVGGNLKLSFCRGFLVPGSNPASTYFVVSSPFVFQLTNRLKSCAHGTIALTRKKPPYGWNNAQRRSFGKRGVSSSGVASTNTLYSSLPCTVSWGSRWSWGWVKSAPGHSTSSLIGQLRFYD